MRKKATETLGYNIFNYISRKNTEICIETLKQIIIYIDKKYNRNTDNIKYIIKYFENSNLDEPDNITKKNQTNYNKIFK